jgi:excisionase family DNA binding protein
MPVAINGQAYYRTTEVCRIVGISRNTLFRWLKEGNITEVEHRDYRGWRLFTQAQVDAMKKKTRQVSTIYIRKQAKEASSAKPSWNARTTMEHLRMGKGHED